MGLTNFPNGISSYGVPIYGAGGIFGPGCGDIHYLVGSRSVSDTYYNMLKNKGVSDSQIYVTLATAYAACTDNQGDVVVAFPATYTVTATLVWAKDNTHLYGTGGPLTRGAMCGTTGDVLFNTTTITQANIVEVTGDHVQFHNVQFRNAGANAACLTALKLSAGRSFYAEGCHFVGHAAATQVATAATSSVWFYSTGTTRPWGAYFKNCKIGDAGEVVRTAGSPIYFSGTTGSTAKYITFEDCVIEGWCETASVGTVDISANYTIDRYLLFKNCMFYNYYVNNASTATEVFDNGCGTTFNCILWDSIQMGHAAWNTTGLNYFYGNAAAAGATGGTITALT